MTFILWYILFFCSTMALCMVVWGLIYAFNAGAGKPTPNDDWIIYVMLVAGFPMFAPFVLARKVGEWVG